MVHQPSGGYQGQATDIEIQTKEIIKTKKLLNEIYAKHAGMNVKGNGFFSNAELE